MKKIIFWISVFLAAGLVFAAPRAEKAGKRNAGSRMEEKSKMKTDMDSELFKTDAEFMQTFRNFSDEEVPAYVNGKDGKPAKVEEKERNLAVLAALLGVQGKEEFEAALDKALAGGSVTPVEAKEVVYQAAAYLGFGKVRPFLESANKVMKARGIKLPLECQKTVNNEADGENSRLRAGNQKQIEYFGEGMREAWLKGDENSRIISFWLADNCFGDYYTRNGLTDKQRELITFCFLASQGGCEPQLGAHAKANIGLGNSKEYLIAVVSQILPYIGYPRSLNAIRIVNEA